MWNENNLKANELGRRAGLEPSTMTGLLDRMENAGLLKRAPDPLDRRASKIGLTKLGIKAEKISETVVEILFDRAFANIQEKDIKTAKNVLRKIIDNCNRGDI